MDSEIEKAKIEAMWKEVLTHGHKSRLAVLPSTPRCSVCRIPFGGVGGTLVKFIGRRASHKSPNLCNL